MDPRTRERVERWESRPFGGGRAALESLADEAFSGAVQAGSTWLFMLNGRIVGVVDGTVEAALESPGTIYEAPDPAVPLLCSMHERGGDTRAKYYTNETPISEVDQKLQDASFTGYVELSEQVLSGDYYLVYYGGRRMAVAYIGNAQRLYTGSEAFDRANDEVGIYEVVDVDVEVTDVPGSSPDGAGTTDDTEVESSASADPVDGGAAGGESAGHVDSASGTPPVSDDGAASSAEPSTGVTEAVDTNGNGSTATEAADGNLSGSPTDDAGPSGITADEDEPVTPPDPGITDSKDGSAESDDREATALGSNDDTTDGDQLSGPDTEATDGTAVSSPDTSPRRGDDRREEPATSGDAPDPTTVEAAAEELTESDVPWATADGPESDRDSREERFAEEARWRETRRIPSIDPEATSDDPPARQSADDRLAEGSTQATERRSRTDAGLDSTSTAGRSEDTGRSTDAPTGSRDRSGSRSRSTDSSGRSTRTGDSALDSAGETLESDMLEREDKIDRLTQQVADLEARREALEAQLQQVSAERDELRSETQSLSKTIEELRSRIGELETALERAQTASTGAGAGTSAHETNARGTHLSAEQALEGTNVFVRYDSKSQPTLASTHDGDGDRDALAENLRLERHTTFDAADAAVEGEPYDTFLEETLQYQFVEWLVGTLPFEIRDTGHADALADLYDVIPYIDRAELSASISLADDDTEDVPDAVTFDVVAFDKRGTPLVVANLNDSREPASREMLAALEEAASAVNANYPDLGAAMVITSSFFDPGALEVTEQATSTGFLSRGSKLNYVSLSRKQGYHLCLVESRGGGFHVSVPEL